MPYAKVSCTGCGKEIRNVPGRSGYCASCRVLSPPTNSPIDGIGIPDQVASDRAKTTTKVGESALQLKYREALRLLDQKDREFEALGVLRDNVEPIKIEPHEGGGTNEAVPLLIASDWHVEEVVGSEIHGNLNRFNPDIAKARVETFFQAGLRLVRLLNQDVSITTVVLALLGDFISNEIHAAESAEKNAMQPTYALKCAQDLIIGGIEFLLNHSEYKFLIPCHSGNHARMTLKTRFSAENGHSLEYLMYLHLAAYFRNEQRIQFQIAEGYHSHLPIYDQMVRFHHGHGLRYLGGVGGLTIPANKAIEQWNKGVWADLDVFGHYHTLFDGRNFLSNGSLIGYNGFALSIKAPYQPPMQWLTLFDKKRGRTCSWPIMFGK